MKKVKTAISMCVCFCILFCFDVNVYADTILDNDNNLEVSSGLKEISSDVYYENDQIISESVYEDENGTIIIDSLETSINALKSKKGTDTATRSRTISGWGTVTITAKFQWYTANGFSYVKCVSMNAYRSLSDGVSVAKWDKSYTSDYVSIGNAVAKVEYQFYNSSNPVQYQKGTFKITCTDTGTISDNG